MLTIVIVLAFVLAAGVFLKKAGDREDLKRAEIERMKSEEDLAHLSAEVNHEIQEAFATMNLACRVEFDAWEARFCSADNPGIRIAGISFQKLSDADLGAFKGTLRAEDWNAFDPNAVAIYRGRKKVGYVPKEQSSEVYDSLANGTSLCYGCIYKWYERGEDGGAKAVFSGKIVLCSGAESGQK